MKNLAITLLTVTTIALGAWCVNQQAKIKSQSAQLVSTRAQLTGVKAELQNQNEAVEHARFAAANEKILQQMLSETEMGAAEQSKKAEHLEQSLAAAKTNNPLQGMAAMFKDPAMRAMIKSQQKAFMGPMLDKQYQALFRQLNLTPEQSTTLKNLLEQKMLSGMDSGFSLLDNSLDASQRADLAKQIKSQTDDFDNQIKQFLGDQNYQVFQTYEKTIPDRTMAGQFSDQLAGTGTALSAGQQEQLVQAMSEARNGFNWTTDLNKPGVANGDYATVFSEANLNKFAQDKERFDQQFLTRAQQILTPAQLVAFQNFQKTQRELQIAGMRMAAQMFGPKPQ